MLSVGRTSTFFYLSCSSSLDPVFLLALARSACHHGESIRACAACPVGRRGEEGQHTGCRTRRIRRPLRRKLCLSLKHEQAAPTCRARRHGAPEAQASRAIAALVSGTSKAAPENQTRAPATRYGRETPPSAPLYSRGYPHTHRLRDNLMTLSIRTRFRPLPVDGHQQPDSPLVASAPDDDDTVAAAAHHGS